MFAHVRHILKFLRGQKEREEKAKRENERIMREQKENEDKIKGRVNERRQFLRDQKKNEEKPSEALA